VILGDELVKLSGFDASNDPRPAGALAIPCVATGTGVKHTGMGFWDVAGIEGHELATRTDDVVISAIVESGVVLVVGGYARGDDAPIVPGPALA